MQNYKQKVLFWGLTVLLSNVLLGVGTPPGSPISPGATNFEGAVNPDTKALLSAASERHRRQAPTVASLGSRGVGEAGRFASGVGPSPEHGSCSGLRERQSFCEEAVRSQTPPRGRGLMAMDARFEAECSAAEAMRRSWAACPPVPLPREESLGNTEAANYQCFGLQAPLPSYEDPGSPVPLPEEVYPEEGSNRGFGLFSRTNLRNRSNLFWGCTGGGFLLLTTLVLWLRSKQSSKSKGYNSDQFDIGYAYFMRH